MHRHLEKDIQRPPRRLEACYELKLRLSQNVFERQALAQGVWKVIVYETHSDPAPIQCHGAFRLQAPVECLPVLCYENRLFLGWVCES
jgi:hypothetical protein